MSDVTTALSDILPILAETFDEPIRSTINRESPLLNWVPKVPYAGEQVDWRVSTGGLTVLNPASAAAWGDASRDTKRKLTLAWGRYAVKILIGYDALTAAAKAPSGMFNLLMTEAQEADRKAITDQQAAGLIMKAVADPIIWLAMAIVFFRWQRVEEAADRAERDRRGGGTSS